MPPTTTFSDSSLDPAVQGVLHFPNNANGDALILTHSAGGNCNAPLLVALGDSFAENGYTVLRCDLPYRQQRKSGPPFPGKAERDRAGLSNAVAALRRKVQGRIFLGGHSYGGRQATMLCAEDSELVSGLLLLSYPLHPPRKPEQLRVQHLPKLRTPCLFIQGTRDPFGSVEEMRKALQLIPAKTELMELDGAGHDLGFNGNARAEKLTETVVSRFEGMFG